MLFLVSESLLAFLKALLQEKILLIYAVSVCVRIYVCLYIHILIYLYIHINISFVYIYICRYSHNCVSEIYEEKKNKGN